MKKGIKKGSQTANAYVKREETRKTLWTMKVLAYTQQAMLDTMMLTLHEFYGFGPERQKQFHDYFEKKYDEVKALERGDDEYAEHKIETALKIACGKYYVPRKERYDIKLRTPDGEEYKL